MNLGYHCYSAVKLYGDSPSNYGLYTGIGDYYQYTGPNKRKMFKLDAVNGIWTDLGFLGSDVDGINGIEYGNGGLYVLTTNVDGTVSIFTNVVPEPSSVLALASGLFGMAGFVIRRRRN